MSKENVNLRREHWRRHHRSYHRSGLSIRDYCEREGIKEPTFRKAVSRYGFVGEEKEEALGSSFIELSTGRDDEAVIQIDIGDYRIRVGAGCNPALLHTTLEVIRRVS